MKRFISFMLATLIIFTALPINVFAALTEDIPQFYYYETGILDGSVTRYRYHASGFLWQNIDGIVIQEPTGTDDDNDYRVGEVSLKTLLTGNWSTNAGYTMYKAKTFTGGDAGYYYALVYHDGYLYISTFVYDESIWQINTLQVGGEYTITISGEDKMTSPNMQAQLWALALYKTNFQIYNYDTGEWLSGDSLKTLFCDAATWSNTYWTDTGYSTQNDPLLSLFGLAGVEGNGSTKADVVYNLCDQLHNAEVEEEKDDISHKALSGVTGYDVSSWAHAMTAIVNGSTNSALDSYTQFIPFGTNASTISRASSGNGGKGSQANTDARLYLSALSQVWHNGDTYYTNLRLDENYCTSIDSYVEQGVNTDPANADALDIISDIIRSRNPNTNSNLIDYMYTSYARGLYWDTFAQCGNTGKLTNLHDDMVTWRNAALDTQDFMLYDTTCMLGYSDKTIASMYGYIRYLEVCQEINSYIKISKPVIDELEPGDNEAIKWVEALGQLREFVYYTNDDTLIQLWNDNFEQQYSVLSEGAGGSAEVGSMADGADPVEGDALPMFFKSIADGTLSDELIMGVSYSAAFVPMRTNMYDPYTIKDWNGDFLTEFHYKYGYNRKALYIVDSSNAAAELANTSLTGSTSVCTLRDLIDPAGDVVLYIDPNFYNVDDLAELLDKSYSRITNTSDADLTTDSDDDGETDSVIQQWWAGLTDNVADLFDIDINSQVKTAGNTQYSQKLRNKVSNQSNSGYFPNAVVEDSSTSATQEDDTTDDNEDHIVLTSGEINMYLSMVSNRPDGQGNAWQVYDDYNVLQGYSIVSSVYRCSSLFYETTNSEYNSPVFIASFNVPNSNSATTSERNEIFNWLLLKNLESQLPIGYNTSLDMDSPVYMDVYGNIITESGYVVVPAASNATLFSDEYCDYGLNMGLLYTYGEDYVLESDGVQSVLTSTLSTVFTEDEDFEEYKLSSSLYGYAGEEVGKMFDVDRISIADSETKNMMQDTFYTYMYCNSHSASNKGEVGYNFHKFANICMEVMRGAPIENIDKNFENLNTARTLTNAGLSAAAKLEVLDESLDGGGANTLLAIPNLAFVEGFEYICLFAFKAIMLVIILVLMFTLYRDMVGQTLSLRTVFKCISLVVITCLSIVTVPTAFDISYYQSNKLLLQDETEYIAMLNEEKRQNGVEIGVTELTEPETSSQLLLKLEDLDVPWYDLFSEIMLSSTYKGLDEVYASFYDDSLISHQEDVTIMNNGVYVYVDDLFDSVSIDIDPDTGQLHMRSDEHTTAAFYTPYYAILEALVHDINMFNIAADWNSYTTTLQTGGRLKSIGVCNGYFSSASFAESEGDILHMWEIYRITPDIETPTVFSDEALALMDQCEWTAGNTSSSYQKLVLVSDRAREFVVENRNLLGKISDETFLKVMALDIAMYHNNLFGLESCNAIEIQNLSQDDLCRLMCGTREEAMYNSTLSFGRYVYEIGGTFAVYLASAFTLIMFIVGYIKPILTIVIFASIFVSLFVFKVCLRKKTSSILGYVVTTLLMCLCNFGHALSLKVCMYLPSIGLTPSVCFIVCTLVQLVYIACLCTVAYVALKDWRDLGFARYQYKASQMEVGANELMSKLKYKLHIKGSNHERVKVGDFAKNDNNGGLRTYDSLSARREERKRKYGIG